MLESTVNFILVRYLTFFVYYDLVFELLQIKKVVFKF